MTVLISPHQFALRGKFLASGYFSLVQCGYVNQTHNFASSCAPLIFYINKILSRQFLNNTSFHADFEPICPAKFDDSYETNLYMVSHVKGL